MSSLIEPTERPGEVSDVPLLHVSSLSPPSPFLPLPPCLVMSVVHLSTSSSTAPVCTTVLHRPATHYSSGSSYAIVRPLVQDKSRITILLAQRVEACHSRPGSYHQASEQRQLVAIKVTSKHKGVGDDMGCILLEQARTEIRVMHRLSLGEGHKNVLCLLDAMEDDQAIYAVLPYLRGRDLCDRMMRLGGKGLRESKARGIVSQVLQGLVYMKAQGCTHGDVSLENVMVDEHGGCKIIDLGMCVDVQAADSEVLPMWRLLGKPSYLCPESVARQEQEMRQQFQHRMMKPRIRQGARRPGPPLIDLWARDAWSLGVVVFTLLLGCPLYADANDIAFSVLCDDDGGGCLGGGLDAIINSYSGLLRRPRPSRLAMDLLHGLLTIDPKRRLSLEAALNHPWLRSPAATTTITTTTTTTTTDGQHESGKI